MTDGDPVRGAELLRETIAWGARAARPAHAFWASLAAVWLADTKAFGELVNRTATLARERGEVGILADALGLHAMRLAVEQHFDDASVAATEAIALVRELRAANLELLPHTALAVVAAFRGRDEEARELAEGVVARATASGHLLRASTAVYALAIADMAAGRWSDAVDRLDALRSSELAGFDPVVTRTIPDKIEAAVRAGRREEVRSDLAVYEERVERSSDPSARPRVAASRALLSDGDEASRWFEEALRLKADALPLDLARIQLLYGEHLRRGRRRAEARLHLRGALEAFERLGAEPWAERARAELRASGETARKRDPSTVTQLTPQELQVARLVADGLSNKEVAAQLFLSPRTIDAHLRSVFAKLGITSRTQLARLALADEAAAPRAVPALA
jgi:DNA-binding CsgD family transcriptional regulator